MSNGVAQATKKTALSVGIALAAGLIHGGAFAQDSKEAELEEIIVTANKREERLSEVAMGISAISGEDLLERQTLNLIDISAQVPGMAVESLATGINRVVLRGQNSGGTGASVAILVDDVPFSYQAGTGNGAITTADLDVYDMSRIEVLRGPQGTLYGATAQGGLVKYVTNKPDFSEVYGGVELGYQGVAQGSEGNSVRGYLNLPITDNLAVRVVGFREDLPGFIDNSLNGDKDINEAEKYGGRISVLFEPTEDLSIQFSHFDQTFDSEGDAAVDVNGDFSADSFGLVDGLSLARVYPTTVVNKNTYSYLSIEYDAGPVVLTSLTSTGNIQNTWEQDATPGVAGLAFLWGETITAQPYTDQEMDKLTQEFRLSSPEDFSIGSHKVDWQAGLFYTKEDIDFYNEISVFSVATGDLLSAPPAGTIAAPSEYEEVSIFGEFTYYVSDTFDFSLGARYTEAEAKAGTTFTDGVFTNLDVVGTILNGFVPVYIPSETPDLDSDESAVTFSFAPRWHISEESLLYARIASGFRPGGPQLPVPGAPASALDSFSSDETMNYEIGFRTELLDGDINVDVTAFFIEWDDIQILQTVTTVTGDFNIIGNAGSAETSGLEWNLSWMPLDGLTISSVGSYVNAELTEDAALLGAFSGDELPFVPKVSGSLNADYRWDMADGMEAYAGLTWSYKDAQLVSFTGGERAKLESYDTLNMQFGIDTDTYFAQLFVRNLTNERALTGYSGGGGFLGGTANINQPRTVGVRVGFNF